MQIRYITLTLPLFSQFFYISLCVCLCMCVHMCVHVCVYVCEGVEVGEQPVRMVLSFHNMTAGDLTNIVRHGSEHCTS